MAAAPERLAMALRPAIERAAPRGSARLVNRLLATSSTTVDVTLRDGVRFRADLADRVQRLAAFGLYERRELDLMRTLLRPGAVVLDIGAHVGAYALHAARAVGPQGRVYAFEAAPRNAARLRENARLNGFEHLLLVEAAVTDRDGTAEFQLVDEPGETGWGSLMLAPAEKTSSHRVRTVAVDTFARAENVDRIDFVKLDVQGSEIDVLTGARSSLERFGPHVLCEVVEAWWGPSQTTTTAAIFELMSELGYTAVGIPPRGPLVRNVTRSDPAFLNVLFTREQTEVLRRAL